VKPFFIANIAKNANIANIGVAQLKRCKFWLCSS